MKLWIRVSLIVVCILVVSVGTSGTVTLLRARASLMDLALERAGKAHEAIRQTLEQQVLFYGQNSKSTVAFHSLLRYTLAHRADSPTALVFEEEVIYSTLDSPPNAALEGTSNPETNYAFFQDGLRVVFSSDLSLNGNTYHLLSESDISGVDQTVRAMTWRSIGISFVSALVGALSVTLAVRRATQPLHKLALSARSIAQGRYAERVDIHARDEVGELARDFNRMAEAVDAKVDALTLASERQQAFVNALSHEMRTPVTSIVGYAETLLTTDMPRGLQEEALLRIHGQSRRLERLSQKMMSLLVLEKGIEKKTVRVPALLDAVREAARPSLEARQIPLLIECDVDSLALDADLMTSALVNLIDNASKASPLGASVRLSATVCGFCVEDQGSGIAPENLDRITQPFYAGDASRSGRQKGVGLGLALVERVARAHGARLRIESLLGKGTKIWIHFDDNKTFTAC